MDSPGPDEPMEEQLDPIALLDFAQAYTWRAQERLKPGYLDALIEDMQDATKVVGIRNGRRAREPEATAKLRAHFLELALQVRLEMDAEREQARRKRRRGEG